MVRLGPDILHSLFLLCDLSFLGDLDHPLDGVYEEDCYEAASINVGVAIWCKG
jgi:hypothetical protein